MHSLPREKREKREKGCGASGVSSQAPQQVGTVTESSETTSLLGLARQLRAALASRSVRPVVPADDGVATALDIFKGAHVVEPRALPRGLRCGRCCKDPTDSNDTRIYHSTDWLPARHDPGVLLCVPCHPTRDRDEATPFDEVCPPVPCPRCNGPAWCALGRWWCEACSPAVVGQHADRPREVVPSLSRPVDPYAAELPTVPCLCCRAVTWRRAGDGIVCGVCHPSPQVQHAAGGDAELDGELFGLAERAGFPRLRLSPAVTVQPGRNAWRRFAQDSTSPPLRADARLALVHYGAGYMGKKE
jgi:hypothetical protein